MIEFCKQNKNSILYFLLIAIIFIVGVYIRLRFYLVKAPMWVDEIMLASSFTDRSFGDLFVPLDAFQKAPPLFFLSIISFCKIFGINEYTLRFIPFLLNISSIFLFYILLEKYVKNKIGILTGLTLFTFCVPLIYFSSEFKPYGCDVFFCILLFLLYEYLDFRKLSLKKTIIYTISSVCFVLISFPSIFIIPAIIFSKYFNDKKLDIKILWILFGIIFAGLSLFLYDFQTYIFLKGYWGNVERGFSVLPSLDFIWTFIYTACQYYVYNFNVNFVIPVTALVIVGMGVLFKESKDKILFILLIFLFAVIASSINAYPLKPKLALYMLPIFILLISKVFDISYKKDIIKYAINAVLIILVVFLFGINVPYFNMTENNLVYYNKDSGGRNKAIDDRNIVKDYCLKILDSYKNDDKIIASEEFLYSLRCYKKFYKYNKELDITSYAGISDNSISESDMNNIVKDIITANKNKSLTIWFIGRDNELYFKCPNFEDIENIIKQFGLKYEKYIHKDVYLICVSL